VLGWGANFGETLRLMVLSCLMVLSFCGILLLDLVLQHARYFVDQHSYGSPCKRRGSFVQDDWCSMLFLDTRTALDDHNSHDGLSQRWDYSPI
jgi:hypothetical protein